MAIISCPKCGGTMESGFTLDYTYGGYAFSHWVEGRPDRSWWKGLNIRGRRKVPITTTRCVKCGFLESYANGTSE